MNLFLDIDQVIKQKGAFATIGTFDGLHLGHRKLIKKLIDESRANGAANFVITFEPHPRSVVSKNYDMKLLTALSEKIELFKELGVENLLVVRFTEEFSKLSAETFIEKYLVEKIGIGKLIIGHDHRLGKGRGGDEKTLTELGVKHGFEVEKISEVLLDDEVISSTKVRNYLLEGDVSKAAKMLGRAYSFSGKVVKGAQRGRLLGFPTANVQLENPQKLIPKNGIYAVKAKVGNKTHNGVMSLGLRPTFNDLTEPLAEIYIFDFEEDIYHNIVAVEIISRLRDEEKFPSVEELIKQMNADVKTAKEILIN
ncbi:MAG TPA: bifunctional riboflavin kinase/FAD synthetase [Ignavibacteriales bacterium]|nr:bifunctional riboflavin kinase/FAD synthetase [Ignavibacteriales bacterium]